MKCEYCGDMAAPAWINCKRACRLCWYMQKRAFKHTERYLREDELRRYTG